MTIPTSKDMLDLIEMNEDKEIFEEVESLKRWGSDGHARNGRPMENIYSDRY